MELQCTRVVLCYCLHLKTQIFDFNYLLLKGCRGKNPWIVDSWSDVKFSLFFDKEYRAFWMENLTVYHHLLGPFFLASFNPSPFRNSYFPFCTNIIQIWWIISTILGSLTSKGFFEWCMSTRSGLFFAFLSTDCAQILQQIVSVRVRHFDKQIFPWKACWKGKKASLWVDVPPLFFCFQKEFQVIPHGQVIFTFV